MNKNEKMVVKYEMGKLTCSICGQEKELPECCQESMILKGDLLCCCTDECHHQHVPECCGQPMSYL